MLWLRRFWQKSLEENRLDSELRFHVEQQTSEYAAAGLSPAEARRRAALDFGGIERFKEECRDVRTETIFHEFLYDIRGACRSLSKDSAFSLLAVFALTIGIGCSTLIFSIVYDGVLNPFPYRGGHRLVALGLQHLDSKEPPDKSIQPYFPLREIRAFRENSKTLEDIAGWMNWAAIYSGENGNELLHGARVTPNAFQFLGVGPLYGRLLTPDDGRDGSPPVVAIAHKCWLRLFHGDPGIVGRKILVNDKPMTVVAIMPPRFTLDGADLWGVTPARIEAADPNANPFDDEPTFFFATGRLKPGYDARDVDADLTSVVNRLATVYPADFPSSFAVRTRRLSDAIVADFKPILYLLFAAVAMLLLISCSNVANLLLVRATSREREIALRASLGATPFRLVRQLLAEALVLAGAGCVAGCSLAYIGLKIVPRYLPGRIPSEAEFSLNWVVLAFAIAVSLATVFLCGLSPALHAAREGYQQKLAGAGAVATSRRQSRLRSVLVIAEIALSMALLVIAGLAVRSYRALTSIDFGFDPEHTLTATLVPPKDLYATAATKKVLLEQILAKVQNLPSVSVAATSVIIPLKNALGSVIQMEGQEAPVSGEHRPTTFLDLCSEDVFKIYDIHLVQGRLLTKGDVLAADQVVVINEAFAREYFAGANPIGRRFKLTIFDELPETPHNAYFQVVGIVSNYLNRGIEAAPRPQTYVPYTISGFGDRGLLVRTSVPAYEMEHQVRETVWSIDRRIAFADPESMQSVLSRVYFAGPEFGAFAITGFAIVGLLLVVVGVFGLMAYSVSLQRNEIGLRMALGAQPAAILRMVLGRGMRLITAGIAIGLVLAFAGAYALRGQFFAFSPADPLTYSAVAALLVIVGLLACWIPARRATRVDPAATLRYE